MPIILKVLKFSSKKVITFDINCCFLIYIHFKNFNIFFIKWNLFSSLFKIFQLFINELIKPFLLFNRIMAILKNNKHLSSNRESFKNLFANNWIIAIIINALIAFIFIVICCYFCVRKKCKLVLR